MTTHDSSITATLLVPDGDGARIPVSTTFRYATTEPVAVTVLFHTSSDDPIEWVFSRELLLLGLQQRAGESDVVIWPTENGLKANIKVSSPFGQAEFQFAASELVKFLDETFALVPLGFEFDHVDLDAELIRLLSDGDVL